MRLRLYGASGIALNGSKAEILNGCLFAGSEAEAAGLQAKWMQEKRPDCTICAVSAFLIPNELILDAAQEIAKYGG